MRQVYVCLSIITIVLISLGCSSTRQSDEIPKGIKLPNQVIDIQTLDQRLAKVPGVTVRGTGVNAVVRIRGGANSFGGSTEPLFVLNGNSIGSYAAAFANIEVQRIKRIKVLKGPDASAYGFRGGSGVVEITTGN